MLGQTIWARGELEILEVTERIKGFLDNDREIWIYENDSVERKTIGEIAKEAVKKIEGRIQTFGTSVNPL